MLQNKIFEDLKKAMKAGDGFRLGVLRMVSSSLRNVAIEKRASEKADELSDEESVKVLEKEAKKRKEAADLFRKGGREELALREESELSVIKEYLPAEASEEEIQKVVDRIRASGINDFPSLMREAMKELRGRAFGDSVSRIVKQTLDGGKRS